MEIDLELVGGGPLRPLCMPSTLRMLCAIAVPAVPSPCVPPGCLPAHRPARRQPSHHIPAPPPTSAALQARQELRELSGQDEGRKLDDMLGAVGLSGVADQLKDLRLGGCCWRAAEGRALRAAWRAPWALPPAAPETPALRRPRVQASCWTRRRRGLMRPSPLPRSSSSSRCVGRRSSGEGVGRSSGEVGEQGSGVTLPCVSQGRRLPAHAHRAPALRAAHRRSSSQPPTLSQHHLFPLYIGESIKP